MPGIQQQAVAVNGTASYASLLKARVLDCEYVTITVENSDTANDLDIQVLVTNDPTGAAGWAALELNASGDKEVTVGEGAAIALEMSSFAWVDVQQKNTSGASAGIGNAYLLGH
jgi:hypothetical protein